MAKNNGISLEESLMTKALKELEKQREKADTQARAARQRYNELVDSVRRIDSKIKHVQASLNKMAGVTKWHDYVAQHPELYEKIPVSEIPEKESVDGN